MELRVRRGWGALVSMEKMCCLFCRAHLQQGGAVLGKVLQRAHKEEEVVVVVRGAGV